MICLLAPKWLWQTPVSLLSVNEKIKTKKKKNSGGIRVKENVWYFLTVVFTLSQGV